MSELVRRDVRVRAVVAAAAVLITSVLVCRNSLAAQLEQAEITTIIHDVQLLLEQAQPRPAAVKDTIRKGAAVRTGADSRTELMFTDQTLARMGANTIFSFNEGTREMNLGSGVMLVHVPKGAGGAKIVTAGVSAGITGTTLMFEYHRDAYSKMIVLEGLVKVWLNAHPEIVVEVHGGEILMIPPHATKLDDPVAIDLATLVATSPLFTDFTPLPSLALIEEVIREQQQLFADRLNKDLTGLDVRSLVFPLLSTGSNPAPPVGSLITFLSLPAGLWSQPASWTPAIVPNNNGNQTFTAIINGGMITQDILAPGVTIQQLQMNGGTLQLDNPLRLNTGLVFTGGSITGGTLNMAGPSSQAGPMGVQNTVLNNSGTYDFTFQSGFAFTGSPGTSSFSNTGTVRKTNGGDVVIINVPMTNTGTVNVLNGAIEFDGGGTNSGTFTGAAGTVVNFASNFSMLNGTRFVGPAGVSFNDGTVTTLAGTISNDTSIFLNSFATFTDFVLNGDVLLTGNGTVNVTGFDRILGNGVLTTNNTIQGDTSAGGSIGANQIGISLQGGTIDANTNGLVLDVDPNSANGLVNKGFLRASNGGILQLNGNGGGGFNNSNGSITALDTSEVHLTNGAAITGGSMGTAGSGVIRNLNTAALTNVINNGAFIADNGSTTTVTGTITDNGSILLNSTGTPTDLILNGDVILGGTGNLTMAGAARVGGSGNLTNQITIQGEGSLGIDQITITNAVTGLINANVSGGTLSIDPINAGTQFGNDGTLRASNGGILLLNGNNGGDFANSGTLEAVSGGALQFTGHVQNTGTVNIGANTLTISGVNGSYLHTAGDFILRGGTVTSATTNLNFQGGLVDAHGTITTPTLNSAATLLPALGGSGLKLNGNLQLLNASNLSFQLGGLTAGSQYSVLNVNGTVGLAGNLVLSFANGFQNSVTNGDTFTITSATSIGGNFANVTSGGTLQTSDGFGSFVVTISGTSITLSGFTPAPAADAIWTGTTGNWNDGTKWTISPNFPKNGQPNGTELYNATLNNGGTISLNIPVTIEKFTMSNGTVTGANMLNVNQLFTWDGGTLAGGVTLNANGGIAMAGGTQLNLNGANLNNAVGQTVTDSGFHDFGVSNGAVIHNAGTWLAQNDLGLDFGNGGTFNNTGTFTRNTGAGTYSINANLAFNNNGIVNVNSGTLALTGGGTSAGSFVANAGGILRFAGTTDDLNAASISGAGTVAIASAAWNLNSGSTYNVSGTTAISAGAANFNVDATTNLLNQSGGTLAIATGKILTINGLFNWSGGTLAGGGTFNANADINMAGGAQLNINGATLNNPVSQTATDSGDHDFGVSNGAIINNGGTWLAQNNLGLDFGTGGTFNNDGTFTRNTGANTYQFASGISFNNTNLVDVQSGTLRFDGAVVNDGGSLRASSTGTLLLNGTVSNINVAGMHALNGGTITVGASGSVTTAVGSDLILNSGTFNDNGIAAVNQVHGTAGTIVVGAGASFSAIGGIGLFGVNGGPGGTLDFTAPSVTFGTGGGDINGAIFNGGNAAAVNTPGGDGGTFTVTTTTGDVNVDADIEASTGANAPGVPTGGKGGTVSLTANTGAVNVTRRVVVSQNTGSNSSSQGGNINITSGKTGAAAVAINVNNSAQLLSLLNAAAPGPGGQIKFVASGAGSKINIQGQVGQATIQADKGLVDIRQTNSGFVNIGDTTPVTIHGDVVKIAALGTNGQLTIGGGTIDADTMLQLYATDATGRITFVSNVSLSGASSKFIAAGTVRINNGVQVNVTGGAAQVFANSAQYSSSNGGDNSTTGSFTGTAAPASFAPLGGQPVLGAPPVPARPTRR